jgi:outer membrane protein OmpA-like peptidoglycan-associated protein
MDHGPLDRLPPVRTRSKRPDRADDDCDGCGADADKPTPTVAQVGNQRTLAARATDGDHDRSFASEAEAIARRVGVERPPDDVRIRWGPNSARTAWDMGAVAFTVGSSIFADIDRWRPGTPEGDIVLGHEIVHTVEQHGRPPHVALLTETEFRRQLGARPEQAAVIDALFANPSFVALWDYLRVCSASPTQDLGPVRLLVTPGLRSGGVERFGGYNPMTRTLEINPTKPEHIRNPDELVDTIVHETIHAVFDLEPDCVASGSPAAPLGGAATTAPLTGGPPPLGAGLPGPGASNPCEEEIDINAKAQRIVTDVIRETERTTRIGIPTITFLNELLRADPAAVAAYAACRGPACGISNPAARQAAISRCSLDVLGTFMTGDLLPSRVLFDFDSDAIRADSQTALELVAIFMRTHGTTHVALEGHADPTGAAAYNEGLGLRRAEAVRTFLVAHGVPASQIDSVTSLGERLPISTASSQLFQDRRVELIFSSAP